MPTSIKTPDIKIKILSGNNRINPSTETSDWDTKTAEVELTGIVTSLKFEEPTPTIEKITYLGSDANGAVIEEQYISEWSPAKISGEMIVNPDSTGTYKDLDKFFLNKVAESSDNKKINYVYGVEKINDADLLIVLGKTYGLRLLMKNFKVTKLNEFDASEGPVKVSFEFEAVAGDTFVQKIRA